MLIIEYSIKHVHGGLHSADPGDLLLFRFGLHLDDVVAMTMNQTETVLIALENYAVLFDCAIFQ